MGINKKLEIQAVLGYPGIGPPDSIFCFGSFKIGLNSHRFWRFSGLDTGICKNLLDLFVKKHKSQAVSDYPGLGTSDSVPLKILVSSPENPQKQIGINEKLQK